MQFFLYNICSFIKATWR